MKRIQKRALSFVLSAALLLGCGAAALPGEAYAADTAVQSGESGESEAELSQELWEPQIQPGAEEQDEQPEPQAAPEPPAAPAGQPEEEENEPPAGAQAGLVYYVDAENGSDDNTGTAETAPWKSLERVNAEVFAPGAKILFRRGSVWTGTLEPGGEGSADAPILVSAYGEGARPRIDGAGADAAIHLYNQPYWEVEGLELTNETAANGKRSAVVVEARDYGTVEHVYLRDLYIHDVSGSSGVKVAVGYGAVIFKIRGNGIQTKFNDIRVEGCTIGENVKYYGINVISTHCKRDAVADMFPDETDIPASECTDYYPSTNVLFKDNTILGIWNAAINPNVCDGVMIEGNVVRRANTGPNPNCAIWWSIADNVTCQYNEVTDTYDRGDDSSAFDADTSTYGSLVQYNYSRNNGGGFMLYCPWGGSRSENSVVRYNVSVNDRTQLIDYHNGNSTSGNHIYNNVFYIGEGVNPYLVNSSVKVTAAASNNVLENNIFYSMGDQGWNSRISVEASGNCYSRAASKYSGETDALVADPCFVDPTGFGDGLGSLAGFRLRAISPCINAARTVAENGGRDFEGNPVPFGAAPDLGAFEYQGEPAALGENLALGTPARADSYENSSRTPAKACDGDPATLWVAKSGAAGHWWMVDLQAPVDLQALKLTFQQKSEPWRYTVYISPDGESWTEAADASAASSAEATRFHELSGRARFIKLVFEAAPGTAWTALCEAEVYGAAAENVALNKAAAASSSERAESYPGLAIDGGASTLWVAKSGAAGNWWMVDLGRAFQIDTLALTFEKAGVSWNYSVLASQDGQQWNTVADRTANLSTAKTQILTLAGAQTARYLKVVFGAAPGSAWTALGEFEAYGVPAGEHTPKNILIAVPHEDDELLIGAGVIKNALLAGDNVKVLIATNGDYAAANKTKGEGRIRESIAGLGVLGLSTDDIILLGYADTGGLESWTRFDDSFLKKLYEAQDENAVLTGNFSNTRTYGLAGILEDYHYLRTGGHAAYTRKNFVDDLGAALGEFVPDEVYTTSPYDLHGDHAYIYHFLDDLLGEMAAADPGYHPTLYGMIVHSTENDVDWPLQDADPAPIQPFTPPANLADTPYQWEERVSLPVPMDMQAVPRAINAKYIALKKHTSQFNAYIASYVKADEIFWAKSF